MLIRGALNPLLGAGQSPTETHQPQLPIHTTAWPVMAPISTPSYVSKLASTPPQLCPFRSNPKASLWEACLIPAPLRTQGQVNRVLAASSCILLGASPTSSGDLKVAHSENLLREERQCSEEPGIPLNGYYIHRPR